VFEVEFPYWMFEETKLAVMVWVPAARAAVAQVAVPSAARGTTEQRAVVPSSTKVTLPAMAPVSPDVRVAVQDADCP